MLASEATIARAVRHLHSTDPVLAAVIDIVGPCSLRPHTDYFRELVQAIIGQQLSLKAAASIEKRFLELFAGNFPAPADILRLEDETLRGVGFSRAKVAYVKDLAAQVADGRILLERLDALTNDEIVHKLTAVKGIGEWTVHMFLLFCMGRLDVLPTGDLGIKNGIRKLYGFDTAPTPDDIRQVAANNGWYPYESVASWYVWRSLELP